MEKMIREILEKKIREEAGVVFEEVKEDMIRKLNERKDQVIAGIVINVMQRVKMESFGHELRITVLTEELK